MLKRLLCSTASRPVSSIHPNLRYPVTRHLEKNVSSADSLVKNITSLVEQEHALNRIGELSKLELINGSLQLIAAERTKLSAFVRVYEVIGNIEDTTQLPCIGGGWDWERLQSGITGDAQ